MSATTTTSVEHPIGPEGLFVLQLGSGDVRLHGIDGDLARVEDRHGNPIVDDFDIETGEGSLAVRARKGLRIKVGPGRHETPDLDVHVPRRATIVVETASGDLTGEDLAGEQRFHTASGDIDLTRISGTVTIEAASGDVDLMATGELRLKARTVSGDLAVRAGVLAEVSAATTSGDLAIAGELAASGSHRVETVSGDAVLALAGGARIEVSTVTGDVSADGPHRTERTDGQRVIVVGDGRATLVVRTMSGDVHVAKAKGLDIRVDAAPGAPTPPRAPAAPAAPSAPAAPAELPSPSDAAIAAAYEDARLTILKLVERGEIDVTEAGRRLEALDGADIPEEPSRG
jgi:Putative adhesin